jgi:flagellar basal-body rod protein FlgF
MDRMIYTAMTGAKYLMQRQDNLANNLANASTPGFRAEMLALRAMPQQGKAGETRVFAMETTTGADTTAGPVSRTGRELDVAMQGSSWLAVQGSDGSEAYTRAGSLKVDANGALKTQSGLAVLGDGGPIVVPADSEITIASDGTVSATPTSGARSAVVVAGRIKMVTPAQGEIKRSDDGLFRTAGGQPLPADERAALIPGALEGSNVNPVEAMVGMISAARQYELQMKLLSTADANSRAAAQLLSLGN